MQIKNHKSKIINAIQAILAMMFATLSCERSCCCGAVEVQIKEQKSNIKNTDWRLERELPTIKAAAERNNCFGDNFLILLAIRKAENGGPGREFGILDPRCQAEIDESPADSLDIQAEWAAATIVKNRRRWELTTNEHESTQIENKNTVQSVKSVAKDKVEFIDFLADRYCPASADPQGNINWKVNVKYFYERFKKEVTD